MTASSSRTSARVSPARSAELQGLMAKADTGVAGPVVAELAYRNDYISVRAQAKLADEGWRHNKCHDSPPAAAARAACAAAASEGRAVTDAVRQRGLLNGAGRRWFHGRQP